MLLAPGETQRTSVRSVGPNDELGDQVVGSLSPRREGPIAYLRARRCRGPHWGSLQPTGAPQRGVKDPGKNGIVQND